MKLNKVWGKKRIIFGLVGILGPYSVSVGQQIDEILSQIVGSMLNFFVRILIYYIVCSI